MVKTGICSVTLANFSVEKVLDIVKQAGLDGIEWWGKGHVPHGDIETARRVRNLTEISGLKVASYGSYYRVGVSEEDGLSFQCVLDTAVALGSPAIRVWAGDREYMDADENFINKVINDTTRIADMAAKKGISITFEYHGGTLTDQNATAIKFASQVSHPNVFFSWQPPHGCSVEHCLEGLEGIFERLSTIHVYHWTINTYEKDTMRPLTYHRHPLAEGIDRWEKYFNLINSSSRNHFALLEFVKHDTLEQVIEDGRILKKMIIQ